MWARSASATLAGLGQFMGGRPGLGCLLLGAELLGWAAALLWLIAPPLPPATPLVSFLWVAAVRACSFLLARSGEREPAVLAPFVLVGAVAATGVLVFISGWLVLFRIYKIPSSAMEPTLMGDLGRRHTQCPFQGYHTSRGGDRIVVNPWAYAFGAVERYDLVTFAFPLDRSRRFVKRVAGMPGEELMIHGGNLFARRPGAKDFTVARKPLRLQRLLWIDVLRDEGPDPGKRFSRYWEAGAPDGAAGKRAEFREGADAREIETLEAAGERGIRFEYSPYISDAEGPVGDVRVAFEFELTGPEGEVFAEVSNEHGWFEARLSTAEAGVLHCRSRGEEVRKALGGLRLAADRGYRLELAVFDGKAHLLVDGDVLGEHVYFDALSKEAVSPSFRKTGVAFGARGVTFKARNLAVGRDIHYRGRRNLRDDQAISIPPDSYLMLGDNVLASHDSRGWTQCTYILKDGTVIRCESQETSDSSPDALGTVRDRLGLDWTPDVAITADERGTPRALRREDIRETPDPQPFPFVERKFIEGRVERVWWPPGRARALR